MKTGYVNFSRRATNRLPLQIKSLVRDVAISIHYYKVHYLIYSLRAESLVRISPGSSPVKTKQTCVFLPMCTHAPLQTHQNISRIYCMTKFLQDVEGSSGVSSLDIDHRFCDLPNRCKMPVATQTKGGECQLVAVLRNKIGCDGNVTRRKFTKIFSRSNVFIDDVKAAIRVAIRPPVVEWATFLKKNRKSQAKHARRRHRDAFRAG